MHIFPHEASFCFLITPRSNAWRAQFLPSRAAPEPALWQQPCENWLLEHNRNFYKTPK